MAFWGAIQVDEYLVIQPNLPLPESDWIIDILRDQVRYFGEPVALVVADSERDASHAVKMIEVEYVPLDVVNSIQDAIKAGAPLIHEKLDQYTNPTISPWRPGMPV